MNRTKKLLDGVRSAFLTQVRKFHKNPDFPEEKGIKYYGFTYYPRRPDFKDPPYEPTKLFLIKRLCKMHGLNPVERGTLETLNIDGRVCLNQHVAIVKNIPEINCLLWKVKHLIKITPIKFVNGLPKDGDVKGTYLRDNGEFIVTEKLKIDEERLNATEKYNNNKYQMTNKYMKEYLRLRWEDPLTADM